MRAKFFDIESGPLTGTKVVRIEFMSVEALNMVQKHFPEFQGLLNWRDVLPTNVISEAERKPEEEGEPPADAPLEDGATPEVPREDPLMAEERFLFDGHLYRLNKKYYAVLIAVAGITPPS